VSNHHLGGWLDHRPRLSKLSHLLAECGELAGLGDRLADGLGVGELGDLDHLLAECRELAGLGNRLVDRVRTRPNADVDDLGHRVVASGRVASADHFGARSLIRLACTRHPPAGSRPDLVVRHHILFLVTTPAPSHHETNMMGVGAKAEPHFDP
jgi:hypothetical protein